MQLLKLFPFHQSASCAFIIFLLSHSTAAYADTATLAVGHTCLRQISDQDTYLDTTHSYISTWFCEPARWFDGFFSDKSLYEEGRAGAKVRWRNDVVLSEHVSPDFISTISARLQLPNTSKRLKLVFESDNLDSISEPVAEGTDINQGTLGFLYDFIDSQKANLSLRLSFSPSITLRYRYTHSISAALITRFTQSLYRKEGLFGTTSRFDIDKAIDVKNTLRWSNQLEIVDHLDGLEWVTALVLFHRINEKSALSYESSITGITEPYALTTDYRLAIRYRRNIHREWLFYEITPQVTWPKLNNTDERHSIFSVTFRLEVFFESI